MCNSTIEVLRSIRRKKQKEYLVPTKEGRHKILCLPSFCLTFAWNKCFAILGKNGKRREKRKESGGNAEKKFLAIKE